MAVSIGSAEFTLGIDATALDRGLSDAERKASHAATSIQQSFTKGLSGIGASISSSISGALGGISSAVGGITSAVGGVVKSLGAIGLAAQGLQAIGGAAKGLGSTLGVGLNNEIE